MSDTKLDTWTPLFSSIVMSSVWGLSPHVRVVWITMLALKDKRGFVAGSVSGLARASVVTVEQCREALELFESPDDDSRTPDNEGRKIQSVDGGWRVLNHERFQHLMREVSTKIGNAKRQARHREKVARLASIPGEAGGAKAYENGNERGGDAIATESLPKELQ